MKEMQKNRKNKNNTDAKPDFIITKDVKAKDANMGFLFDDLLASEPDADFAVNFRRAISRELLHHCSRLGLTPGRLAQKAEMPLSTLNNVLHGGSANSGILTLLSVCRGLGVELDELITVACNEARAAEAARAEKS